MRDTVYTRVHPRWASATVVALVGCVLAFPAATAAATAAQAPPDDSQELPSIAAVTSVSHVDPVMSAAASTFAGRSALVRCLSAADWATLADQVGGGSFGDSYRQSGGWTTFATGRISLSPDVCRLVALFTYKRYFPTGTIARFNLAQAFAVYAHETGNVSLGQLNDAAAECRGEQWIAPLARLLRSTVMPANARLLAAMMWRYRYPQLPDSYRSPDCRDGGPLDLNPSSSVWP
jgi:hypothetical protein